MRKPRHLRGVHMVQALTVNGPKPYTAVLMFNTRARLVRGERFTDPGEATLMVAALHVAGVLGLPSVTTTSEDARSLLSIAERNCHEA